MTASFADPTPDFFMGEGDSLPVVEVTVTVNGLPVDLTGYTGHLLGARDDYSAPSFTMPITINPDQVANKGKLTFQFFSPGVSTRGLYNFRLKMADGTGQRISFDSDRQILVLVTPDPGS